MSAYLPTIIVTRSQAVALAAGCIDRSQWVEITPLPDDQYGIDVRADAQLDLIHHIQELEA